jgi:hypothetical protein
VIDLMLDLETLGKKPGCVITAIGAVVFDPEALPANGARLGAEFYQTISIADSCRLGFEVDGDTLEWWITQDNAARAAMVEEPVEVNEALLRFCRFLQEQFESEPRIWSCGPSFDISILKAYFDAFGAPIPWHYRAERCVRTVLGTWMDAFDADGDQVTTKHQFDAKVEHHALEDAKAQAVAVSAAYRQLTLRGASL